ncbi:hypothetical protein F2Q68_00040658 [Brassica cretica]|uniref:Uncharacterized protein n=1 Tax=Brassica cretica TaxID=69181 RepID=A0A8S9MPQ8_BRACR|nr:hypothetical protein F2Q68_00040658 [Brassica cretica]
MEEKDVRSFIKREEFEKLSSGLLERLIVPCQKALDDSGLSLDQIHSVELVGSGSRIPAISKMLSSLFKRELGRTVNASDMLLICSFRKASSFQVLRFLLYVEKTLSIWKPFTQTMTKYLRIHQVRLAALRYIGPFHISHGEAARVKVRVQLNLHGIVSIDSASLIEDHKENMTSEEMISENNHQSSATKDDTLSSTNDPKAIKRTEIPVVGNVSGALTKDELLEAKHREYSLVEQDLKMESTKDKKNALESFVYEMRDKMLNTYRNTATELERECIARNLQETEEWLYEDGDDESENAYIEKLNDIKKLIDPIENRFKDGEERVQASKDLQKAIADNRMAAESLPPPRKNGVWFLMNVLKPRGGSRIEPQNKNHYPKTLNRNCNPGEIRRKADALNATCKYIGKSNSPPT